MRIIKYIASAILLAFSAPIFGQNNGQVVDKIIAKVDDKIILKSDLESAYISFLSSPEAREFQGRRPLYNSFKLCRVQSYGRNGQHRLNYN